MTRLTNRILLWILYLFLLAPIIAVVVISFNPTSSLAIET